MTDKTLIIAVAFYTVSVLGFLGFILWWSNR